MVIHYRQFCALARALELLGERWTLLIIRELLLGPKRFTDLRGRLDGISSSVLAERLSRLEEDHLVQRRFLEPPAASTVYELTPDGRALEAAVFELVRWGTRFLYPQRPDDRIEPDWLRLILAAYARRDASPAVSFAIRLRTDGKERVAYVTGGPDGTRVSDRPVPTDLQIVVDVEMVLGLVTRTLDPVEALQGGQIQAVGNAAILPALPQLFDLEGGRDDYKAFLLHTSLHGERV